MKSIAFKFLAYFIIALSFVLLPIVFPFVIAVSMANEIIDSSGKYIKW